MQVVRPCRPASLSLKFLGPRTCRRSYSESSSSLLQLPPAEEWYTLFEHFDYDRAVIKRMDTARLVANSFLGDQSSVGGEGKVIIEAFPGTCTHDDHRMLADRLFRRARNTITRSTGAAPLEGSQAHHPRGQPGLFALSEGALSLLCTPLPSSAVHTRH